MAEIRVDCEGLATWSSSCKHEATHFFCDRCFKSNEMTPDECDALKRILDFVERWNKKDEEKDIAEAAVFMQDYLDRQ